MNAIAEMHDDQRRLMAGPKLHGRFSPGEKLAIMNTRMMNNGLRTDFTRSAIEPIEERIQAARSRGDMDIATDAIVELTHAKLALNDVDNPAALCKAQQFVMRAGQILDRRPVTTREPQPSPRKPTPEPRASQQIRTHVDRESSRYRTSLHESAHAWAVVKYTRPRYVNRAEVLDSPGVDGRMGAVFYDGSLASRYEQSQIAIAGWAIQDAVGYSAKGLGGDAPDLRALGWRTGDENDPIKFAIHEPAELAALRRDVQRDMRDDWRFIGALADALYLRGFVSGDEIRQMWQQYGN